MALKVKLTAEEFGKLSDEMKAGYKQSGDVYLLDAEGIDDISALNNALDRLKKEAKDARDQAAKFKDVDPERYKTLIAEAEQRDKEIKEKKGEYDSIVKQMQDNHKKELEAKDTELKGMRSSLDEHLIGEQANAAIAAAKGEPKLLSPHIKGHTRVVQDDSTKKFIVQVIDDSGNPRVNSKNQPMTITDLVAEMKADKVFGRAFDAKDGNGGGAPPARKPGDAQQQQTTGNKPVDRIKRGLQNLETNPTGGGAAPGNE
jgi:hypothetical protein